VFDGGVGAQGCAPPSPRDGFLASAGGHPSGVRARASRVTPVAMTSVARNVGTRAELVVPVQRGENSGVSSLHCCFSKGTSETNTVSEPFSGAAR